MLDRNVRRTSFKQGNQLEYEKLPLLRRLRSETYKKKLCMICQIESKNVLRCIQTLQMGDKMLLVVQKLSNKSFYRWLNTISAATDAPANDVIYHNTCSAMLKEKMIKRELKFYGNSNLDFLGPNDVTNDECQLNRLNKLVLIVSQFIIQSFKLPKQAYRNKSIDAMRNINSIKILFCSKSVILVTNEFKSGQ